MPAVSVIVPNYNHAQHLQQRLASILNQTFQDFEIILLDDCSTDNSLSILSEYAKHPKVSYFIKNEKNSGSTFCQWEKGIELSKGEFIWIAESDDYADHTFLEKLVTRIQQNSKAGLVYCQSWQVDASGNKTGNWISHTNEYDTTLFDSDFSCCGTEFIHKFLIHKNVIPNASAVIFKKSLYDKALGINSAFKFSGDWFLWLKILMLSDVFFISESLNYFRKHENSVIHQALRKYKSDRNYLNNTVAEMRKAYSRWLMENCEDCEGILQKNGDYISIQEKTNELFSNIYNGNIFISILSAIRYSMRTLEIRYIFVPIQRIVTPIWKLILRIVKGSGIKDNGMKN